MQKTTLIEQMENENFTPIVTYLDDYEKAIYTLLREKNVLVKKRDMLNNIIHATNGDIDVKLQVLMFYTPDAQKIEKLKVIGSPESHENWEERFDLKLDWEKVKYLKKLHELEDLQKDWIERIKNEEDNEKIINQARTITHYENLIKGHKMKWREYEIMKGIK
jgi:hypothetical protein